MKKISLALPALLIFLALGFARKESNDPGTKDMPGNTGAFKQKGWVSLFDGKTTKGWHVYNHKSDGSAWKVVDGILCLDTATKSGWQTRGGGDLVTDGEYENYQFSVEWKISEGGNSGIIFGIHEDAKYEHSWHTGPEMQVLDNERHGDAKFPKHRAGDLYDLIACNKETVKPAGQWNKAEIVKKDGKLDLYLNDVKVVSTVVGSDSWKALVAGSKFKTMPDFGTYQKGHIALQDHGNSVCFRNIRIKEL